MSVRSTQKSENVSLSLDYVIRGGNAREMAVRLRMCTEAMSLLRDELSVRRNINGQEIGRVEVPLIETYCGIPVDIDDAIWVEADHAPIADVVAAYHRQQAENDERT